MIKNKISLKYLGALIHNNGMIDSEIAQKLGKADMVSKVLKIIWNHSGIMMKFKIIWNRSNYQVPDVIIDA